MKRPKQPGDPYVVGALERVLRLSMKLEYGFLGLLAGALSLGVCARDSAASQPPPAGPECEFTGEIVNAVRWSTPLDREGYDNDFVLKVKVIRPGGLIFKSDQHPEFTCDLLKGRRIDVSADHCLEVSRTKHLKKSDYVRGRKISGRAHVELDGKGRPKGRGEFTSWYSLDFDSIGEGMDYEHSKVSPLDASQPIIRFSGLIQDGESYRMKYDGTKGEQILFLATSKDFNPRIAILDPDGKSLPYDEKDDKVYRHGEGFARLYFTFPDSGAFTLELASEDAGRKRGDFSLQLKSAKP
jgi:hypothetical protein